MMQVLRTIDEILGSNLLKLRKSLGISQREAAKRIGLPLRTYQRSEECKGEKNIELSTIKMLAAGYGVEIADLFTDPESEQNTAMALTEIHKRMTAKTKALKAEVTALEEQVADRKSVV